MPSESIPDQLTQRLSRIANSDVDSYRAQVNYFLTWASSQAAVKAALDTIERSEPDLDVDDWYATNSEDQGATNWPDTEIGQAKIALGLLQRIGNQTLTPEGVAWSFSYQDNANAALREFTTLVVEPLFGFIKSRLVSRSEVVYLLERYRRRLAWFDQDRLWAAYEADTAHGEAIYDKDLRSFLFSQGVDYPFSQPSSASGKADIVALLETDQPLTCEVKLFNGSNYGSPYLSQGLHQAIRYADDYGKTEAYLVIFNLTERLIELPTDEPEDSWPPRLNVAGITVFLVSVQAAPQPSASASGRTDPWIIERAQLVTNSD